MRFNGGFFNNFGGNGWGCMIKVNVVAVGKVKEKYFAQGIEEYAKRLGRF